MRASGQIRSAKLLSSLPLGRERVGSPSDVVVIADRADDDEAGEDEEYDEEAEEDDDADADVVDDGDVDEEEVGDESGLASRGFK